MPRHPTPVMGGDLTATQADDITDTDIADTTPDDITDNDDVAVALPGGVAVFHGSPGEACSCSEANANEIHQLVMALAAHKGVDLCDASDDGDEDEGDDILDLRLVHDLAVAQGAECGGEDEDDMDDEDGEGEPDEEGDSGEFEVSEFSDVDDESTDTDDDSPDESPATFSTDTPSDPDPTAIHDVATFALDPLPSVPDDEEWVEYKNSLLFRAGDYPRKSFSLDPDELRTAAANFAGPIPNEFDHMNSEGRPTILDGKLGHVSEVRASEDGSELRGTVVIPKWLDRVWATGADGAKKVSCVWNRANKALMKLGLVVQGHVPDAALMAAFSEFAATHEGDDTAEFSTPRKHHPHMTHAWQSIHDQCAMVPGICPANPAPPPSGMPAMMGDLTLQHKHLKVAHDNSVSHGAQCMGSGKVSMSDTETTGTTMPKNDAAAIEADLDLDTDTDVSDEELNDFVVSSDPYKALQAELAQLKQEKAAAAAKFAEESEAARVKSVEADAKAYAKELVTSGKSTTAEFGAIESMYLTLANLDHKLGETVTFSDGAGGTVKASLVEAFRAREAKRSAHTLFAPALGDGDLLKEGERALFNTSKTKDDEGPLTEAKRREYLQKSQAGIAILAQEDLDKKGK